ncbi:MAG: Hpt domain-containing protein [Oscillospiraceae bacterium]|nr:Hpt domain-containing protein [Oscillospiraceae bacterium]
MRNLIELNRLHADMAGEIRAKTEKLSRAYLQIVEALAASVDAKDRYTHGHSSRVAAYSRELARRAGYGILAHSIKSTSRTIGATAFAERARELELAAKEGRTEALRAHHAGFAAAYRALAEGVRAALD